MVSFLDLEKNDCCVTFFLLNYDYFCITIIKREAITPTGKNKEKAMKLGQIRTHDTIKENNNGIDGIFLVRTYSQCLSKFQNPAEVSLQITKEISLPEGFSWMDLSMAGRGNACACALVINSDMQIVAGKEIVAAAISAAKNADEQGLVDFLEGSAQ